MKKIYTLIIIAMALQINAQQFVSTEQQNRNVFIEEYTGKNCTWCPEGQMVANGIARTYPGRVFLVNIHAGSFSPANYPNLNTEDGTAMVEANQLYSFPAGYVNRTSEYAVGREQWSSYTMEQLAQPAECNIDGQVVIDPVTREATINVEVYYTSNSSKDKNYLTVMMLQDDIVGDQEGGQYNPEQYINGEYHHKPVLRDVVTPTWGEEISPTTEGTLITKTYNYTIPEIIGDPNGTEAVIDNIYFIAFVSEFYDGYQTCPVLNVNELLTVQDVDAANSLLITEIYPASYISCSENNVIKVNVANLGKNEINNMKFETIVNGVTSEFDWEGSLLGQHEMTIDFAVDNLAVDNVVTVKIVEINTEPYEDSAMTIEFQAEQWLDLEIDPEVEEETLTIEITQDKYGHQTKWYVIDSDYNILASGGPYQYLDEPGTVLHTESVTLSQDDCVKFIITDSGGNGINNGNGEGSYRVMNSKGDVIIDGNGQFDIETYHLISVKKDDVSIDENVVSSAKVYPNPSENELNIECDGMQEIMIYMTNGQLLENVTVNSDKYLINITDYTSGIYFLKIVTEDGIYIEKIVKK